MKNKWRILKIFVTVILLGFLLSFSLKRFSEKPLEQISVNMSRQNPVYFIDEKDVKNIVKKYVPTRKIGDIDIPALEKKLKSLPAVDSADVYLDLNGKLNLDIKQRVPVFRLNNGSNDFYVDKNGVEFPISKNYSHPCMLVTGEVSRKEYRKLGELISKIDKDSFSRKYFIGISKDKGSYNLLTSEGNFKVEIGDLDNIEFKVKGFKTFAEKYLVYQEPEKYSKISVRYDNQIVTTLNPNFEENDSIITSNTKEIEKAPLILKKKALAAAQNSNAVPVKKELPVKTVNKPVPAKTTVTEKKKVAEVQKKAPEKKKDNSKNPSQKPKTKEPEKKKTASVKTTPKPKTKVKVE